MSANREETILLYIVSVVYNGIMVMMSIDGNV